MKVRAFSAGWATGFEKLLRRDGRFKKGRLSMTCLLVCGLDALVEIPGNIFVEGRLLLPPCHRCSPSVVLE